MKIAILGYSGAGKSTLANILSERYGIGCLHLDSINFSSGWVENDVEQSQKIVNEYMDAHDDWVIEGNYSQMSMERRLAEADRIIFLNVNRFTCLYRAFRRSRIYRGRTRPDMAEGCIEKFDFEFMKWILYEGRTSSKRNAFRKRLDEYKDKVTVINNLRELAAFIENIAREKA